MLRMKHWGLATYHAEEGLRLVEAVTDSERIATENGEAVEAGQALGTPPGGPDVQQFQPFQSPDLSFLPALPADSGVHMTALGGHSGMLQLGPTSPGQDPQQRQLMMQRLQTLETERMRMEQEMERLRNELFAG